MKLATLKDGSRDGLLAVVSRDLCTAHFATGVATRLQQVLDDWNFVSPQLEDLSAALNAGRSRHPFAFDPGQCMAPLPRVFARFEGAAYPSHARRIGTAQSPHGGPRLAPRAGDALRGAREEALFALPAPPGGDDAQAREGQEGAAQTGADFAAGLAAVTGDIAHGSSPSAALEGVRLLMLGCDFQLRSVREDASDAGTAFSPVALTPDELGPAWRGGRVQLELSCKLNGRSLGRLPAGSPMQHHFGQLIAALAAQRPVGAGTLVGSGAISSEDGERGTACLFERRALEAVHDGAPSTPWLAEGDRLRIEMLDAQGRSPFGAIDVVVRVAGARAPLAAA